MALQSLKEFATDFIKLEKFDRNSFTKCHKKIHSLLASLRVTYMLTTPKLVPHENETIAETRARMQWEQDD